MHTRDRIAHLALEPLHAGLHPQTLRMYEQKGLVRPQRTAVLTSTSSPTTTSRVATSQSGLIQPGRGWSYESCAIPATR